MLKITCSYLPCNWQETPKAWCLNFSSCTHLNGYISVVIKLTENSSTLGCCRGNLLSKKILWFLVA